MALTQDSRCCWSNVTQLVCMGSVGCLCLVSPDLWVKSKLWVGFKSPRVCSHTRAVFLRPCSHRMRCLSAGGPPGSAGTWRASACIMSIHPLLVRASRLVLLEVELKGRWASADWPNKTPAHHSYEYGNNDSPQRWTRSPWCGLRCALGRGGRDPDCLSPGEGGLSLWYSCHRGWLFAFLLTRALAVRCFSLVLFRTVP